MVWIDLFNTFGWLELNAKPSSESDILGSNFKDGGKGLLEASFLGLSVSFF